MSELELIDSEVNHLIGDSQTTAMATGGVAELLKGIGGAVASSQAGKERDAAEKKSKAEMDAKLKEQQAIMNELQAARTRVQLAEMDAATETNPAGPLHKALIVAQADVNRLQAKLGYGMVPGGQYNQYGQPSGVSFLQKQSGPLKNWQWGLVGVGSAVVLGTLVHLIRKR
jgi:hypothetical protein